MKKSLFISFNNTTPPPQVDTQQDLDSNSVLYSETGRPDYVNTVEIGFTSNKDDQNFAPGDYLELDFSALRYENGGQLEGVDTAGIALSNSSGDWAIPANQTGPKIKLQCAKAFTWKKGDELSVSLQIPVNPVTDSLNKIGDFALSDASYFGVKPSNECVVTMASFGARQKPLPVRSYLVDPATKVPDIPAKEEDVVFITPAGLDDIPNKLSFELDYSRLTNKKYTGNLGAPELTLSIQAGNDDWDLAPPNSAQGIALNIAHDVDYDTNPQWTISHVDNENFLQFKCTPVVGTPLLPLSGGNKIRLELTNIVTALPDGTVNMVIQISGMDDYADWCWFLTIQKEEPEPQIVSFDIASPTDALISVGQAVKLTWQTFAIKDLELNYVPLTGPDVKETLTGKLTEKDGYPVIPAGGYQNVPDDFTERISLPFNLVATKADGQTISKQVSVMMNPPDPFLEISGVTMQVDQLWVSFSYMTRFTNKLAILKDGNSIWDMPVSNGARQSPQTGPGNFYRLVDDDIYDGYYWPADSQSQGGDCKITLKATNQEGETYKELWFNKLISTGPLGWGGADPFKEVVINKISITSGGVVDAIIINDDRHGGGGGSLQGEISLSWDEYITKVIVHNNKFEHTWATGIFDQNDHGGTYYLVTYLEIHTNKGGVIAGGQTRDGDDVHTIEGRIFMLGGNTRGDFLEALNIYYLP